MNAETMQQLVAQAKKYARIDYTDDDDLVEIMVDATVESMADVIPEFDRDHMTARQKIALYKSVKSMYDDRDNIGTEKQQIKLVAASIMLSEIYEPKKAVTVNG